MKFFAAAPATGQSAMLLCLWWSRAARLVYHRWLSLPAPVLGSFFPIEQANSFFSGPQRWVMPVILRQP